MPMSRTTPDDSIEFSLINSSTELPKDLESQRSLAQTYPDRYNCHLKWYQFEYYLPRDTHSRYSCFKNLSITLVMSLLVLIIINISLFVALLTNPFVFKDMAHRLFSNEKTFLKSMKFRNDWYMRLPSTVTVQWLNQGETIKPIHSHNDYWRGAPLFEALSLGIESVEADIWTFEDNEEIYVGHNLHSLSSTKTLSNLYLKPLEDLLDQVNINSTTDDDLPKKGVFYEDPSKTLYLLIDIKNNPILSISTLKESVKLLQEKGFLTYYDPSNDTIQWAPITMVLTGDYPLEKVKNQDIVNLFVDAPLAKVIDDYDTFKADYVDNKLAMLASSSLRSLTGSRRAKDFPNMRLSKNQTDALVGFINKAHELGLRTRVWETPNHPIPVRNNVWKQLISLGSDILNADNLRSAAIMV